MNFLRRIYLLLLGLLFIIAVTLLLLSPQAVGGWVASISELSVAIRIGLTIVIDLFLLALMYLQVRPDPGAKVNGLVMRGSGAITEVSVESARDRILKAVSDVPDVVSAEATVKPVRGRAEIEMQVVVMGDDVKLPNKQKDINRALRQVIDKQLGLQMAGQPRIHIRIHGEDALKPPVIEPAVEREIPAASTTPPLVPPVKIEPKPSTGLLGGWTVTSGSDDEDVDEPLPEKSAPVKADLEPEPTSNPLTSLFGGLRREREDEDDEAISPPDDVALKTDTVSPLLSEAKPVIMDELDAIKTESAVTGENKVKQFDLDEELLDAVADDVVEDDADEDEDEDIAADELDDSKKLDGNDV